MRLITKKQTETFLASRFSAFVRKHGPSPAYSCATVLAFAGMLSRDASARECTALIPWQVAKDWALSVGVDVPRGDQPWPGSQGVPFTFPQEYVHDVAALVNFPGEPEQASEPEYSEELECEIVIQSEFTGNATRERGSRRYA